MTTSTTARISPVPIRAPLASVRGRHGCVASADQLATQAGIAMLQQGGNAVDAALATNAAMAVVGPHLCGIGGDLLALVHVEGVTYGLNSSGRAPAAADAEALRAEGMTAMPFRHDIRSVTVPGCVDGWIALHERFAALPLDEIFAPAIGLAAGGFACSPLLVDSVAQLDDAGRRQLAAITDQHPATGEMLRLPAVARTLRAIADGGRDTFYGGEFGAGLVALGDGWFTGDDLAVPIAKWVEPLTADAFGVTLATIGPNSQGYLALAIARLVDAVGLPDDPDDEHWAHLFIEAITAASYDRPSQLFEGADGADLLALIDQRVDLIDRERASARIAPGNDGDTTYLCTTDGNGMGVSLIQSNASGFGSWLAEPNTGIGLHNRGLGFSLQAGHPAELAPGRRPPHTLLPAMAVDGGHLRAVFGTMGGDAQPQVVAELAARLFRHGQLPQDAINAGRVALRADSGFDTWTSPSTTVMVEGQAPAGWADALAARGHRSEVTEAFSGAFGHAHAIVVEPSGFLVGAYDPRTIVGSAAAI